MWCSSPTASGGEGGRHGVSGIVSIPPASPMTLLLHQAQAKPEGWLVGNKPDMEIPTYTIMPELEDMAEGWKAAVALMVEYQTIDPTVAAYIYDNIDIQDNGLEKAWFDALVNCGAHDGSEHSGGHLSMSELSEEWLVAYEDYDGYGGPEIYTHAYYAAKNQGSVPVSSGLHTVSEGDYTGMTMIDYIPFPTATYAHNHPYASAWKAGVALAMEAGFMDENLAAALFNMDEDDAIISFASHEVTDKLYALAEQYGYEIMPEFSANAADYAVEYYLPAYAGHSNWTPPGCVPMAGEGE